MPPINMITLYHEDYSDTRCLTPYTDYSSVKIVSPYNRQKGQGIVKLFI